MIFSGEHACWAADWSLRTRYLDLTGLRPMYLFYDNPFRAYPEYSAAQKAGYLWEFARKDLRRIQASLSAVSCRQFEQKPFNLVVCGLPISLPTDLFYLHANDRPTGKDGRRGAV